MSLQEKPFGFNQEPVQAGETIANVRPLREDVFIDAVERQPWHYDTQIVSLECKGFEEADQYGNQLSRWRATFDDNTKLAVSWYHSPDRISDVPTLQTPAWMTGSRGHNQISDHKLARAKLDTLLIGHVGEERDSWPKEIGRLLLHPVEVTKELLSIDLAKQAHQMLQVQRAMAPHTGLSATEANIFGESRGAMTGIIILAIAARYGISVNKAFLVCPCFETGLGPEVMQELQGQIGGEVLGLLGDIGHVSLGRLVRSASTINLSPKSALYEAAHAPTLFRGVGKYVDHIDHNQNALILGFDNDLAGQTPRWQKRFAPFPNVLVQPAPKAHVSGILDERTVQLAEDYFLDKIKLKLVK